MSTLHNPLRSALKALKSQPIIVHWKLRALRLVPLSAPLSLSPSLYFSLSLFFLFLFMLAWSGWSIQRKFKPIGTAAMQPFDLIRLTSLSLFYFLNFNWLTFSCRRSSQPRFSFFLTRTLIFFLFTLFFIRALLFYTEFLLAVFETTPPFFLNIFKCTYSCFFFKPPRISIDVRNERETILILNANALRIFSLVCLLLFFGSQPVFYCANIIRPWVIFILSGIFHCSFLRQFLTRRSSFSHRAQRQESALIFLRRAGMR